MEHNDAINNKQASWEACKLFWLKLAQATKHTKLCRTHWNTLSLAKVLREARPKKERRGNREEGEDEICAAKKFKCLCEINCCPSM